MKCLLFFFLVIFLVACTTPTPTAQPLTPAVSPSPVSAASPLSRSPLPLSAVTPNVPPTLIPAIPPAIVSEPTHGSDRSAAGSLLLPAVEQTLDLGPARFANYDMPVPLALDTQADRLYVSLSPSRTVVLDANTLAPVDEIPFGGALSVAPLVNRLYIGVPGSSAYQPDGTTVITPAELKLLDAANLALLRGSIPNDQSTITPRAIVDPSNNRAYIVQDGITVVDATTLDVQGTLSGTFPIPDAPTPNYSASNAALVPTAQRLFVSLDNGLAGSNSGHVLAIYDLSSGRVIQRDAERSVSDFGVDETTGDVFSPRSNMGTNAIVKYDSQGNVLKRLAGLSGLAQVDAAHARVYLFERGEVGRIVTFDRNLNLLGVSTYPANGAGTQFAIVDPERDRLYILQGDGKLIVLKGHAQPIDLPPVPAPDRHAVLSIIPSTNDPNAFDALFAFDEYVAQGSLFRTRDGGATWHVLNGWLLNTVASVSDTLFAAIYQFGPAGLGVWGSSDGGQTWQPASRGLTDLAVTRLAVSPDFVQDGTLYALSQHGVFRSTDRGALWTPLADRYAPLLKELTVSFSALAISPNFASDNTLLLGHSSGLWRSTDRGETWTNVAGGPPATRLAYAPNGSIVFAIAYDGVHRSDDGGLTWSNANAGLDVSRSLPTDVQVSEREAIVLLTTFDQPGEVYRLPLTETTWQQLSGTTDVTALALTPDGTLFIGTKDGRVRRTP